ncbi:hypothetical protein MHYP_G00302770 [Metynnis hypsauchen]
MVADDLTEWGDVNDKEERAKNRSLGYTTINRSDSRFVGAHRNILMPKSKACPVSDHLSEGFTKNNNCENVCLDKPREDHSSTISQPI